MASTEPHRAEVLEALDASTLAMLDSLVVHSHWNQTAADWALFARAGRIHVLRDGAARIVASGATLPMGAKDAWISMVLVDPALRGRGLGRAVFEACLNDIESQGRSAWLDATPAGEALYLQYGFSALWRFARWQRDARPAHAPLPPAGSPASDTLDALIALDADALGLPRGHVIDDLARREGSHVLRHARGFAIVRAGRVAHQVGPLIATDEAAATQLLREIARGLAGPVFVDVPDARPLVQAQLAAAGFTRQRPFARMLRGASTAQGQTNFIQAVAGPEYG